MVGKLIDGNLSLLLRSEPAVKMVPAVRWLRQAITGSIVHDSYIAPVRFILARTRPETRVYGSIRAIDTSDPTIRPGVSLRLPKLRGYCQLPPKTNVRVQISREPPKKESFHSRTSKSKERFRETILENLTTTTASRSHLASSHRQRYLGRPRTRLTVRCNRCEQSKRD